MTQINSNIFSRVFFMSILGTFLSLGFFCNQVQAQKLSVRVLGGAFIGSPYTFDGVPEGSSGKPVVGPMAGIAVSYQITERIAVRIGGNYARKGSEYLVPIEGKTRVERSIFGLNFEIPFNLSYEGTADGKYDNEYIDIPLSFVYGNPDGSLSFFLGSYASKLLKSRHTGTVTVRVQNLFNVNDEPFDQSEFIDDWDFGVHLGAEYKIFKGLSVMADGMLGMVSLFSENPEGLDGMYRNIFLKAGLSYKFGIL